MTTGIEAYRAETRRVARRVRNGLFVAVAVGAGVVWMLRDSRPDTVLACEGIIQDNLKAPATYRQIDTHHYGAGSDEESIYITFEAQNAMGVPLRIEAHCTFASSTDGDPRPEIQAVTLDGVAILAPSRYRNRWDQLTSRF
jgi:hypothetical protein